MKYHTLNIFWVRIGQRFPVLENVTPIAFVIEALRAVFFFDVDGKAVPGSAWIAVAAAEGQRQVSVAQADQVSGTSRMGMSVQFGNVDFFWEGGKEIGLSFDKLPVVCGSQIQ